MSEKPISKTYQFNQPLKYGCNPHQSPAALYVEQGRKMPFETLNGSPGYINLLDALNAWQLVKELRQSLGLPAAASFKHVSPAGAGLAVPLDDALARAYEVQDRDLSPSALAYIRARGADPLCSFGDFAAFSDPVDRATAEILKTEVSDGLIAPGFEEGALEILKAKKGGKFIVLQADQDFEPPEMEIKELYGVLFSQRRNDALITPQSLAQVPTREKHLTPEAIRDLVCAAITIKYTQSNSVGYALGGQMIGVGAGQQSRVDCTKLAGRKVETWWLRMHPRVLDLPFKPGVKRVDRTNARVRFIEGDFTAPEYEQWKTLFDSPPEQLTLEEKSGWLKELGGVSLASDAFFPFRDSIDQAAKRGVKYILQPGGSVADEAVLNACDDYGMVMAFTGIRLFHH
ncbi:MAG: phosphoribosylaminoimidazolecarboxamide formyltransferase [Deltaproteobacteria bacterium]|nr:phosphoribosylaminoimidazolecarboxamide formyltransferase [Deltaproteobacteria bacterium]